MKAILLHHAGGDKYAFRNLQHRLLPEMESIALELPGRSDRFSEGLLYNIKDAVEDMYEQMLSLQPLKYCIIGNSMGTILAFLLTQKLQENGRQLPEHLFLASRLSPDAYKNEPNVIGISSDDFWKVVQQYDGVPEQLLAHKELKEFYEPVLRADFELLQRFNESFESAAALDVPTSVLLGHLDTRNVTPKKAQGWKKFFSSSFDIRTFEGGHFFLYENEDVVKYIKSRMAGEK